MLISLPAAGVPSFSSSRVFISYRRADSASWVRLLQSELRERIPGASVLVDLDFIEAGWDFAEVIREAIDSCAVLVAMIGPKWATLVDEQGRRRLDDPDDYVRFELRTALGRGVRVIPVLVEGAMPLQPRQLPPELQKLAKLNALEWSHARYEYDTDRLLDLIQRVLADAPAVGPAASDVTVSATGLQEFGLFAPEARIRGYAHGFLDRQAEVQRLARDIGERKSLVVIEGVIGSGKTALAARLCQDLKPGRVSLWVFCSEKGDSLTVNSLAKGLALHAAPSPGARLRAVADRSADLSAVIDGIIDLLAAENILLVLDDFHHVRDDGLRQLVRRLEHSELRSTILLTSSRHGPEPRQVPLMSRLELRGLPRAETREFLRQRDVDVPADVAALIWEKAGMGNPQALTLFAGQAVGKTPALLAVDLPAYTHDLESWIAPLYLELAPGQQAVARAAAFIYEPATPELIRSVAAIDNADDALAALQSRFVLTRTEVGYEMHGSLRDYLDSRLTADERNSYAARITAFYQASARQVFLDGLSEHDPSYGLLYLEGFPEYFADTERHIRFVDDLLDRLADNGIRLERGSRILVLGSGDGTHDPAFAKHGLQVTNVDIQPEIADRGQRKAASLPTRIEYVVADMTKPLPDAPELRDMDAVFNIGSSFGFEDQDAENAAIFRQASAALRPGAPFIFEYVNGERQLVNRRLERQIDVTVLPSGAVRTKCAITNPQARTSVTAIHLERPDGTGGWFHHFMHYYSLDEVLAFMRDAGLEPLAIYGGRAGRITGEPFDKRTSGGMVIIAVRR